MNKIGFAIALLLTIDGFQQTRSYALGELFITCFSEKHGHQLLCWFNGSTSYLVMYEEIAAWPHSANRSIQSAVGSMKTVRTGVSQQTLLSFFSAHLTRIQSFSTDCSPSVYQQRNSTHRSLFSCRRTWRVILLV